MRRAWLPLTLVLGAGAAILFWPSAEGNQESWLDDFPVAAEEEEERTAVDAELPPEITSLVGTPELDEAQRTEVAVEEASEGRRAVVAEPEGEAWVTFQIANADGVPLAGAVGGVLPVPEIDGEDMRALQPILFTVQGAPTDGVEKRETLSDEEGRVRLAAPAGTDLVVYARLPRHLISFKLQSELEDGAESDLGTLRLAPGGYLEVRVVDDFGGAVQDASVIMVLENGGNFAEELPIQFLKSDEGGRAIFEHLSFKEYKLEVVKHGFQHQRINPVAITPRGDGLQEVTLSKGEVLEGQVVTASGAPAEGARVRIRARSSQHRPEGLSEGLAGRVPPIVTDATGSFLFEGLFADAEYDVSVDPARGLGARERTKPRRGLLIGLPETAFIRGQVVLANGDPVSRAEVGFQLEQGAARRRPRASEVRTDENGFFEAELRPGRYEWYARADRGEYVGPGMQDLRGEIDLGQLTLLRGGDIAFRFEAPNGDPASQVRFRWLQRIDSVAEVEPDGIRRARDPVRGSADDVIRFEGLAPGQYRMYARSSSGLIPPVTFDVLEGENPEVEVGLQPAAYLWVTVEDENGNPADRRFRLEAMDEIARDWVHVGGVHRVQQRSGRATRIGPIVPGRYLLREERRGAEPFAEFVLTPGEERRTVTLPSAGR